MAELKRILVFIFLEPVSTFPAIVHLVENRLRNLACPVGSCTVCVEVCLVDELHILLSGYQTRNLVGIRHTYIAIILNSNLAFLTLLRGNEDDTVGSTSTIDGSRSGILQYVDALDVVWIQTVQTVIGCTRNNSVDNEEWGRLTDGSHTTDVHLESLAWLSRALCDVHTGSLALQCSQRVCRVHLRNVLTLHRNVGTGEQFLLLNTITDNNHLFQCVVLLHVHVDDGLIANLDFLALEAHVRHHQSCTLWHIEREVTVCVGNCTSTSTFHLDGGSHQRTHVVHNSTCHLFSRLRSPRNLLGISLRCVCQS